jgi:hypothetical protein
VAQINNMKKEPYFDGTNYDYWKKNRHALEINEQKSLGYCGEIICSA